MNAKIYGMKIQAIAYGIVTDVFLTKLFGLVLLIALLDPGSSKFAPIEYVSFPLIEEFSLAVGLMMTALGGFVAGRRAGTSAVECGFWVGFASLVVSHLFFGWSPAEVGLPLYALGTLLSIPAAASGALASRRWAQV
jgi:hypothetical protein